MLGSIGKKTESDHPLPQSERSYYFKAFDKEGKKHEGRVQATEQSVAYQLISADGLSIYELSEGGSDPTSQREYFSLSLTGKPKPQEISQFAALMAILYRSRVAESILFQTVVATLNNKRMKDALEDVAKNVIQGRTLSFSISQHRSTFPKELIRFVAVGERANNLADAFDAAANYFAARAKSGEKMRSILAYPIILLVASMILFIIIIFVWAPTLSGFFEQTNASLPSTLNMLMNINIIISKYGLVMLTLLATLAALISSKIYNGRRDPRFAGDIRAKIPIVGTFILENDLADALQTIEYLLKSGATLAEAVHAAVESAKTTDMHNFLDLVKHAHQSGEPIAPLFSSGPKVARQASGFISVAETSNRWQEMLSSAVSLLRLSIETRRNAILQLLPAVVTLFLGSLIGLLLVSVVSALMEVNQLAVGF